MRTLLRVTFFKNTLPMQNAIFDAKNQEII